MKKLIKRALEKCGVVVTRKTTWDSLHAENVRLRTENDHFKTTVEPDYVQHTFERIYREDYWNGGSGVGSWEKNTREYRELIQRFLHEHDITSVLDLGCGDWQFSRLIDWTGIHYTGVDVVPSVIESNRSRYSSPNVTFLCGDILRVDLPRADLVLIKDVLQHIPNAFIIQFLKQLEQTCPMALITNCVEPESMLNQDICLGSWRPLDLSKPPFCFHVTTVLEYQNEEVQPEGRRWKKKVHLARFPIIN